MEMLGDLCSVLGGLKSIQSSLDLGTGNINRKHLLKASESHTEATQEFNQESETLST